MCFVSVKMSLRLAFILWVCIDLLAASSPMDYIRATKAHQSVKTLKLRHIYHYEPPISTDGISKPKPMQRQPGQIFDEADDGNWLCVARQRILSLMSPMYGMMSGLKQFLMTPAIDEADESIPIFTRADIDHSDEVFQAKNSQFMEYQQFRVKSIEGERSAFHSQSEERAYLKRLYPNPGDVDSVVNLAKMSHNAYLEPNGSTQWHPIDGYRANMSYGFGSNGIRGYVYSSDDGELLVIAIKGTSTSFFGVGGGPTGKNDKLHDNLLFSCCCAKVDWSWTPVCPCASSNTTCSHSCLRTYISRADSYLAIGELIYRYVSLLYPDSTVWFTGHSLGGALASLLGQQVGAPAITFEAPGDRLAAERLGLKPLERHVSATRIESVSHDVMPVWQFGLKTDPIFVGKCNGIYSACYLAGYAMETKCHSGNVCLLDDTIELPPEDPNVPPPHDQHLDRVLGDGHDDGKGSPQDIRTHRMGHVLELLEKLQTEKSFKPECHRETTISMRPNFIDRTEYDRGVNTFSPEGRLFQVEYALEAIKLGSTAIGIQTSEGVVLAVEKRVTSPLLEPDSIQKVLEIDTHIGCAMSGLTPDSRTMIDHARVEAQNHHFTYNEKIKVESVAQAVCDLALRFGEGADGKEAMMSRPFGVALLIAGIDENGPQLFHADPSGTFVRWSAKAMGAGSEGAQTELQEHYHKNMTLKEAESLAFKVLKHVMEEKLSSTNVQMASVTSAKGFQIYTAEELQRVIDSL